MFVSISVVLMVAWMFLYLAVQVPKFVSCTMLSLAFSLFALDWWIHSRRTPSGRQHERAHNPDRLSKRRLGI